MQKLQTGCLTTGHSGARTGSLGPLESAQVPCTGVGDAVHRSRGECAVHRCRVGCSAGAGAQCTHAGNTMHRGRVLCKGTEVQRGKVS